MCNPGLAFADDGFLMELHRLERLNADRRWGELDRLGSRRPLAELYLTMHRERRAAFIRAMRALPATNDAP